MYHMKLLQLLGIKEHEEQHYLHIQVHIEQDEELFWKVDAETAASLLAIVDFRQGHSYRLSFKSFLDVVENKKKSTINQTYRDQSKRLEFTCSESYLQALESIKQVETVEQLDKLDFLSRKLVPETTTIEEKLEIIEMSHKKAADKKRKRRIAWPLATALITIAAMLFTYTGHSILTNAFATPGKSYVKESITAEKEFPVEEETVSPPESMVSEENITIDEEPSIPFFELGEGLAYEVPEGMVALTFDDGPSQFSLEIMETLKEYGAGGTFFFIGSNVNKYPDYVEQIFENGYGVGTHSMNHVNLSQISHDTLENELVQSNNAIKEITGEDVTLFRPPFGHWTDNTKSIADSLNQKVVLWNNDPKDWESLNTNKIIQHIKATDVNGSIIILHENHATINALPEIIEYLQAQGLQLVTLR